MFAYTTTHCLTMKSSTTEHGSDATCVDGTDENI